MKYRDRYRNDDFCLTVRTNSRIVQRWIADRLDFGPRSGRRGKTPVGALFAFDVRSRVSRRRPEDYSVEYSSTSQRLRVGFGRTGSMELDFRRREVLVQLSGRPLDREFVVGNGFFSGLRLLLADQGLFFLHASAVAKGRNGLLISGPQNSGKTTISFLLARHGFEFLSDDDCFVRAKGSETIVLPFPTKVGFNPELLALNPDLSAHVVGDRLWGGVKQRLSSGDVYGSSGPRRRVHCRAIIFPSYSGGKVARLIPLPKEKALRLLMDENAEIYRIKALKHLCAENFWTMHNLVSGTALFELRYNDRSLASIPALVRGLI